MNEYVFKKSHQAVTLDCKCSIKIQGDIIQIDPQLLYQRLHWLQNAETNLKVLSCLNYAVFSRHCLVVYSFFVRLISLY